MKTIDKKFPFRLSKNNVKLPEHTRSNDDLKLNFFKSLASYGETTLNVELDLCKSEFTEFVTYIKIDTDSSKNLFPIDLNIDGSLITVICDITSNISATLSNNSYNISFSIALQ